MAISGIEVIELVWVLKERTYLAFSSSFFSIKADLILRSEIWAHLTKCHCNLSFDTGWTSLSRWRVATPIWFDSLFTFNRWLVPFLHNFGHFDSCAIWGFKFKASLSSELFDNLRCVHGDFDSIFGRVDELPHHSHINFKWCNIEIAPCQFLDVFDSLKTIGIHTFLWWARWLCINFCLTLLDLEPRLHVRVFLCLFYRLIDCASYVCKTSTGGLTLPFQLNGTSHLFFFLLFIDQILDECLFVLLLLLVHEGFVTLLCIPFHGNYVIKNHGFLLSTSFSGWKSFSFGFRRLFSMRH